MIFAEEVADVFERGKGCYLAHCISSDYALGAGIAVHFRKMGVAYLLGENYPDVRTNFAPCCLETTAGTAKEDYKGVFNLVTKEKSWQKPAYDSLRTALVDMRKQIEQKHKDGEAEIVVCMPLIGCGLDKLQWDTVREVITDVFLDTDVLIVACRLYPETE